MIPETGAARRSRWFSFLRVLGALNIALGTFNVLAGFRISCLNLLLGCLLMYGLGCVHGKVEQLKRDLLLFE